MRTDVLLLQHPHAPTTADTTADTDPDPHDLPDRIHQVETLHLKGWTNARIAAHLGVTPRTVRRDLKRIEAHHLDRLQRHFAAERVHSLHLYRAVQANLWKVIDALMNEKDHKSVATASRAVVDSEKAANAILDRFEKRAASGRATIRDLVTQFAPGEIEAAALLADTATDPDIDDDSDNDPYGDTDSDTDSDTDPHSDTDSNQDQPAA